MTMWRCHLRYTVTALALGLTLSTIPWAGIAAPAKRPAPATPPAPAPTEDGHARLVTLMRELSGGMTVAPPEVVVRHEIEQALGHYFPERVVPAPFQFLGSGLTHALAKDFGFHLE